LVCSVRMDKPANKNFVNKIYERMQTAAIWPLYFVQFLFILG
jgi:hypothetical protein